MGIEQFVGLGAFVALVINVLKRFGVIPDNWAGFAALVGDLLIMVVVAITGYLEYDLSSIDAILGLIAQLLALLLTSFVAHRLGRAMELPLFRARE